MTDLVPYGVVVESHTEYDIAKLTLTLKKDTSAQLILLAALEHGYEMKVPEIDADTGETVVDGNGVIKMIDNPVPPEEFLGETTVNFWKESAKAQAMKQSRSQADAMTEEQFNSMI